MQAVANANQSVEFGKQWEGQTVDSRFPLDQFLGGVADEAVFLTRLPGTANKAALKLILASSRDAEAQLAAWKRAARLSHPNLIRIYDGGRCRLAGQDILFVVSEFADENLGQVVPQRALNTTEAEAMLAPVLDALAYLHNQGLVHGRLRPSNVMAVNDQLKVASDSVQTPGAPLQKSATPYDAPEVARGQLSPAADVWSLGATLAQALTQSIPRKNAANLKLAQPFADIVNHSIVEDPGTRWTIRDIHDRVAGKQPAAKKKPEATATKPAGPGTVVPMRPRTSVQVPGKGRWPLIAAALVAVVVIAAFLLLRHRNVQTQSAQPNVSSSAATAAPAATRASQETTAPVTSTANSGDVVNRVLPNPSRGALNTIHGRIKIRVRVAVDANGNVTHAGFVTSGPSQYFARLALQAAQQWKFAPGASSKERILLFEYTRHGVDASEQAAHGTQ